MSVRKQASSSMATPCSSVNVAEQFLVTDWTSLVSMDQNVDFNSSIVADQFPRHSSFINDDGSFDLLKSSQISSALSPQDMHFTNKHSTERSFKGKKRKSVSDSPMDRVRNVEDEQQRNVSPESVKSPTEASGSPGGGAHNPTAKHANETPQDGDACKEDYIHVRAKRGQATNSHSLAERVRREKISERMRLLQDLVPGCNKITGKAMMLDEIINYVQSLQRQVEFLSMKLAAVNPELHFDVDQILSKDILQSRDGSLAAFECAPGMSTFHPHFHGSSPQGIMQPGMAMSDVHNSGGMMRSTIPLGSPMAQIPSVWDDELQTVLQMGFIPNPPLVGSELNGSMKMEL